MQTISFYLREEPKYASPGRSSGMPRLLLGHRWAVINKFSRIPTSIHLHCPLPAALRLKVWEPILPPLLGRVDMSSSAANPFLL
jgi:hypothetical protein